MKAKFLHDISANTLQVIINQLCGLFIFYMLSTYLIKNDFGEINWSLAVLLTTFNILSFGIDQVAVKRIASGSSEKMILSIYFTHVLLSGLLLYGLLFISQFRFHGFFQQHQVLLLLGISKLMIFFSSPFKQLAIGKEKFKSLLVMSVSSNIIRSLLLTVLAIFFHPNLPLIITLFIISDTAEFLISVFITKRIFNVPVIPGIYKNEYSSLIKESLPQLGVNIFTSAIARFDWIFLGLLGSSVILAEYSFAYKVFEMATLPLLVIAPILITRFTKLFNPQPVMEAMDNKINDLFVLLRLEMVIASLSGMLLTVLWRPVIDGITNGKYGLVNQYTILILSACLPFLYFNNMLWTINFAKGRLKMIFVIFAITFFINITGDIILIPLYKAEGAAMVFLLASAVQTGLFLQFTRLDGLWKSSYPLLLSLVAAIISGFTANNIFHHTGLVLLFSLLFYFLLLIVSRQIRKNDRLVFKRVTGL